MARHYEAGTDLRGVATWQWLVGTFGVVVLGAGIWSYPWTIGVSGFKSHSLFWVGASVYFLAAFALLGVLGVVLDGENPRTLVPGLRR